MVICDRYNKIVNVSEYIQCNTLREGALSFLNFPQILEKSTRQARCAQCIKAFVSKHKNQSSSPRTHRWKERINLHLQAFLWPPYTYAVACSCPHTYMQINKCMQFLRNVSLRSITKLPPPMQKFKFYLSLDKMPFLCAKNKTGRKILSIRRNDEVWLRSWVPTREHLIPL